MSSKPTMIVMSHTLMGKEGFCTMLGEKNTRGDVIQIRPKKWGYAMLERLVYSDFPDQNFKDMRPGDIVSLDNWSSPDIRQYRSTHPEDVVIEPNSLMLTGESNIPLLENYAKSMAYMTVKGLFPNIEQSSSGKAFTPGNVKNLRSVGYVWADEFQYFEASGDENTKVIRASFKDSSGQKFSGIKVSGVDLQNPHWLSKPVDNVLLRLSLAGPLVNSDYWEGERCYMMLSHIIR